ncbi:MAG: hypothetical protein JXR48_17280 [Candidatus Delongbacteria bacterium]|nr:hypothetical protein [Candidatus Delongbacteria bacterium]MBN2836712.1 hypothetical protein [Candidatus Delongbacteria bacterium]
MRDIIITAASLIISTLAIGFTINFSFGILVGIIVGLIVFLMLSRRIMKELEEVQNRANKAINNRNIDRAVKIYESALSLGKKSPFVKGQVYGMLGMLHYVTDDLDKAIPALEKSSSMNWVAKTMLAVVHFKKKEIDKMEEIMKKVTSTSKKEGLVWGVYAYLLARLKRYEDATKVLEKGLEKLKDKDERLKTNLIELKNNRPMKMKVFGDPWYQFRLEDPPKKKIQQEMPGFIKYKKNAHYRG